MDVTPELESFEQRFRITPSEERFQAQCREKGLLEGRLKTGTGIRSGVPDSRWALQGFWRGCSAGSWGEFCDQGDLALGFHFGN